MSNENKERRSLYGRKCQYEHKREKGKKRYKRTIEEKLRKYTSKGEGYFFIPALMHTIERCCSDGCRNKTDLEQRLEKALDQIPGAKKYLQQAVKLHKAIPGELKNRLFSRRYLNLEMEKGIDDAEAYRIMQSSIALRNRNVFHLNPEFIGSFAPWRNELPGACCCCCASPSPGDLPPPPPPQPEPNQYELTFTHLYCVDESNPEWYWLFGRRNVSDEVYVVFGVITEEMAESGTPAQIVHTPLYQYIDDGERRPASGDENLRIFGFTGARSIDSSVLVTATCFEWDGVDPDKYKRNARETTDKIRSALTAVAIKAASKGGTAGWVVAGVSVLAIGVSYLVDLLTADNQIGDTIALSLTQEYADSLTSSVNPAILDPLHFNGGDDDGIYDVYLKLQRV